MALVCTKWDEWIDDVWGPVDTWETHQEKRCKEYAWYDPRGWFCWLVDIVVKVIKSVIIVPAHFLTHTICVIIATAAELIESFLKGAWDFVTGLLTLNWRKVLDGLMQMGLGLLLGAIKMMRILFLGDAIDFFRGMYERGVLRDHVRTLLEKRYRGDTALQAKIADAINLDGGSFGLNLHCTVYRSVLDSQAPSPTDPTAPNLVVLHESGAINLRELCGFEFTEGFFNRKRYKTLKKEDVISGGGGGEFDNPISEDELNTYLSSRGAGGPAFTVLCMRDSVLDTKLDTAEDKATQLGLKLHWNRNTVAVSLAGDIKHTSDPPTQDTFLADRIGRTRTTIDPIEAAAELAKPDAVGVFRYIDGTRGLTTPFAASACGLTASDASGVTFIDCQPDVIWKYVLVHELGHYFGLCHVSGIDRIMVTSHDTGVSLWSWAVIPNIYLKGEPHFTLDEAKSAWTFIIDNFPSPALANS